MDLTFWVWLVIMILSFCFGFVLLFGAPYVPTLTPQVQIALRLADLKKGQTLLELGCGDGKVLVAAGKAGCKAIGYELNPILALICWLRTRKFKGRVTVVCGNFWTAKWPPTDAIFTFLHPRFMNKLDKKIIQSYDEPVKLVSFAFPVPDRKPAMSEKGILLYKYL